jgi:diphosphomevalonate decarboxylase
MTLSEAVTTTTVCWDSSLGQDEIYLGGERILDHRANRISRFLDRIRDEYYRMPARVASVNSFPAGTGLASSASGFAALATAALGAFGEGLPEAKDLSRWARRGSGSACRSIEGGFVEWVGGTDDDSSYARQLCTEDHWDLRDLVVLVSDEAKEISSSDGHRIATRHPFMSVRQQDLAARMLAVKGAVANRDITTLGEIVEHEALEVQGIMLSGQPSALYLAPMTVQLMQAVRRWRGDGLPVYITLDAGPNLHVLCEGKHAPEVRRLITQEAGNVPVLENKPGPGVRLHDGHLI